MNKEQAASLYRILRGGSWYGSADYCRESSRYSFNDPADRGGDLGFRPCRRVTHKSQLKEFKELIEEKLFND